MTADLDNAFRYELDEIIERGLSTYRPILSHVATATFRNNLAGTMTGYGNLQPWIEMLTPSRSPPLHGTDKLTAGQVALLGGTRPLRILHSIVLDLDVLLDGGDKQSLKRANRILGPTCDALQSLVDHHVVAPAKGRDASARKLGAFVDLGIAAQIASTMGALHYERLHAEDASGDEVIQRYFLGMVQIFGRITLARNDQQVFSDHYIDVVDVEGFAADQGRDLSDEVARRHGFLKRLAAALRAQIQLVTGPPAPDPTGAELPATRRPTTLLGRG